MSYPPQSNPPQPYPPQGQVPAPMQQAPAPLRKGRNTVGIVALAMAVIGFTGGRQSWFRWLVG